MNSRFTSCNRIICGVGFRCDATLSGHGEVKATHSKSFSVAGGWILGSVRSRDEEYVYQ